MYLCRIKCTKNITSWQQLAHVCLSWLHDYYVDILGNKPVAWKEYCVEHWLKELQESMNRCTGRDITEMLLKMALNTIQSIDVYILKCLAQGLPHEKILRLGSGSKPNPFIDSGHCHRKDPFSIRNCLE